ncbi:MAG TPA: hypothetical protein ENK18_14710 [Deltaproteobacteria bacterium]|nr:hypothetical protein [Deltaproteobacteria bacterium]
MIVSSLWLACSGGDPGGGSVPVEAPGSPEEALPSPHPPEAPPSPHTLEVRVDAGGSMAVFADDEAVPCGDTERCADPQAVLAVLEGVVAQQGWEGHDALLVAPEPGVRHAHVLALLEAADQRFPRVALRLAE